MNQINIKFKLLIQLFFLIQLLSIVESKLSYLNSQLNPTGEIPKNTAEIDNCLSASLSNYQKINFTESTFIITFSNECNGIIIIPNDLIILIDIEINGNLLNEKYIISRIENEKLSQNQIIFRAQLIGHTLKIQIRNKNQVEFNIGEKQRFRFTIRERYFISTRKVTFSRVAIQK